MAAVAAGDGVLTVHGVCPAGAEDCSTEVTREQFDNLLKIAAPGAQATAATKRNFARTYTDLLAYESAAKKSGIESSPQFQETMEWLRLRTLAELYRRQTEKDASVVSDEEIDEYYLGHLSQFEEVKLRRMLVPRNNLSAANKQELERKALEIAAGLRERAAQGEDLDKLQQEAYTAAGISTAPPTTDAGNRRRAGLVTEVSDDVFALNPGDVSRVEKEPYSYVVYKVDAKRTLPRELVREEISREIIKRRKETALSAVTDGVHADLNEKYFGSSKDH
jgi:parvulin-like peptidyl-prolyl isomerase